MPYEFKILKNAIINKKTEITDSRINLKTKKEKLEKLNAWCSKTLEDPGRTPIDIETTVMEIIRLECIKLDKNIVYEEQNIINLDDEIIIMEEKYDKTNLYIKEYADFYNINIDQVDTLLKWCIVENEIKLYEQYGKEIVTQAIKNYINFQQNISLDMRPVDTNTIGRVISSSAGIIGWSEYESSN